MSASVNINPIKPSSLLKGIKTPYYLIVIFDGNATFSVDFTEYVCSGKNLLFLSPYQLLKWEHSMPSYLEVVRFHGDFYCIEYHKKEVACNGILFNNIYQQPFARVTEVVFEEVRAIIRKMQQLGEPASEDDHPVLRSYLQLILALSSKEKQQQLETFAIASPQLDNIIHFQQVLEEHFSTSKDVAFYAERFGLAVNTFSKKTKKHFGKSPSKLIQERIVLEAKKLLHLTHKPVKEIAMALHFEDEFYFSRYFKKEVGVSPKQFREQVGISIVAE